LSSMSEIAMPVAVSSRVLNCPSPNAKCTMAQFCCFANAVPGRGRPASSERNNDELMAPALAWKFGHKLTCPGYCGESLEVASHGPVMFGSMLLCLHRCEILAYGTIVITVLLSSWRCSHRLMKAGLDLKVVVFPSSVFAPLSVHRNAPCLWNLDILLLVRVAQVIR
jgi:hypothetical protein